MSDKMNAVIVGEEASVSLGSVAKPVAGTHEVLIEIKAAGINRADLLQRRGMYPPPPGASHIMGLECAGIIVAVGDGVSRWKIGDRVCALLAGGGYAAFAAVDQGSVLPIPDALSFVDAACFAEAMMTVWANEFDHCVP